MSKRVTRECQASDPGSQNASVWAGLTMCLLVAGLSSACADGSTTQNAAVPAEFRTGEAKFKANCAGCHGERAAGTAQGPPLVHRIYEPNHHPDITFQRAAANGVRAHHWNFGNMPKIDGVTPEDVDQIIRYVRWLQRQAGIN